MPSAFQVSKVTVDPKRIAHNVAVGKEAREAFKYFETEFGSDKEAHFWEVIVDLAKNKLPHDPKTGESVGMTDDEARRFENKLCPGYSMYAGDDVGDVPPDYLLFLAEGDAFIRKLRRYVRSKRFQKRYEAEKE